MWKTHGFSMENDIQMVGKLHIELLVYHMKVKLWLFLFLESNEHNFWGLIYSHGDVYFLTKNYPTKRILNRIYTIQNVVASN